jgi:hypothetical protein
VLGRVTIEPVPVPADCTDGFTAAYWRRPMAYLDEAIRANGSTFALLDGRLAADGVGPARARSHRSLLTQSLRLSADLARPRVGYRLVVAELG